jgi:hypothetical protein
MKYFEHTCAMIAKSRDREPCRIPDFQDFEVREKILQKCRGNVTFVRVKITGNFLLAMCKLRNEFFMKNTLFWDAKQCGAF